MEKQLVDIAKEHFSEEQCAKIMDAYEFAKSCHDGQKRDSGEDYIVHPCNVAIILIDLGLDYETIIAGLLHDVVEDTHVAAKDLEKRYGKTVVSLVNGVTKLNKIKFESKVDEQAENLRKMFLAMTDDIRVVLIKLADRLHNMRTLSYRAPEKQKTVARETMEIYAPIAARLGVGNLKGELEDLAMRYLAPDDYYDLVEKVAVKREQRQTFVDKVTVQIREKLAEMAIEGDVHGRPKHFYSIFRKMKSGKTFEQIYDLIAVRIIVDNIKDCYAILGAIHTMWKPFPGRFKDYIAMPKPNKYQSLHTTVIPNDGSPFEIQIRTLEMHKIAEYGIAAHWKYKEGLNAFSKTDMEGRLQWLRSIIEEQKDMSDNAEFLDSLKLDLYADEVFVITPKGDVVNLPQGSTGVDFAYHVHSEVGNKCVGIKIDGKIVPLTTKLTNNTIIEIITSNNSKGPSRDWLKFVVTTGARNKIRAFFKKEMMEENIKLGKEMLEREARHRGYNLGELINPTWLEYMNSRYNLSTLEEVYESVGYGAFTTNKIIIKLIDSLKGSATGESSQIIEVVAPSKERKSNKGSSEVLIKGFDDFLIRLSHCCNPVPGDRIIGYISRGRGVSIHRADCPNMKNIERERIIEASWPEKIGQRFVANVEVIAEHRNKLIADISITIANMKVAITRFNARLDSEGRAIVEISVEIENIDDIDLILKKMSNIEGVYKAYRV